MATNDGRGNGTSIWTRITTSRFAGELAAACGEFFCHCKSYGSSVCLNAENQEVDRCQTESSDTKTSHQDAEIAGRSLA